MIVHDTLFVDGWRTPSLTEVIKVYSASTAERIGHVPLAGKAEADAAVTAARRSLADRLGYGGWSVEQRIAALDRLADALDARRDELITRVSMQNGMPIRVAGQVEGTLPQEVYRYYAQLLREAPESDTRTRFRGGPFTVERHPVGVVAAIVPWNYPQLLLAFKLAPAIAAGCTVVVKVSPETVLDSFVFADAVQEAQIPRGVINILPGGADLGAYLVTHPGVDKVAFTGSTATGRVIAESCGRLLRPVTLELGGKSAAIILDDVDLSAIAAGIYSTSLINNGQTCVAATRILAPRSRYEEVVDFVAALADSLVIGNSLDPATQIGPLASSHHRDRVEGHIRRAVDDGARLVAGGERPAELPGWFVRPTVFADVANTSALARDEVFGPVLAITPYDSVDEAIALANDSEYGLGGVVWTADLERGREIASQVQTGTIGVNFYTLDPAAPFGGIKASGLGRELGPEGLSAYQTLRTIHMPSP